MDKKSSRYYKIFAVFASPLLEELMSISNKGSTGNTPPSSSMVFHLKEGHACDIFNRMMKSNGIPFTVSSYRQWHPGYAKGRSVELRQSSMAAKAGNARGLEASLKRRWEGNIGVSKSECRNCT